MYKFNPSTQKLDLVGFKDAPADGTMYGRRDGAWERITLMPPVEEYWDITEGLPPTPDEGDRYISDGTDDDLGWYDGYVYEWDGTEWVESIPVEGWMVWLIFEMVFWVFFSGGWMEVGSDSYLKLDQTTPQLVINGAPIFEEGIDIGDNTATIAQDVGTNMTFTDAVTGTKTLAELAAGGGGTPGGSDTQVQFNDGGAFGGDAGLTYTKGGGGGWLVDGKIYDYRKELTIDNTKIDANLTDFPVLVNLTSANFDFAKSNSNGFDIRFTDSDGETLLKYERERHDSVNSLAEYWVKIPSVSSSADTTFYIYYRTEDTDDGSDAVNVWDANFKGVWHSYDKTTTTISDSTTNANTGTKKGIGEPVEAAGQIARAQSYDGVNDYVLTSAAKLILLPNTSTYAVWFNINTSVDYSAVASNLKYLAPASGYSIVPSWPSNRFTICAGDGIAGYVRKEFTEISVLTTGVWYHVAVTYNGAKFQVFIDGVYNGEWIQALAQIDQQFLLGRWAIDYGSYIFNGLIDEVRISDIARSDAWIKADYNSGANTLLTYGGEEVAVGEGHLFVNKVGIGITPTAVLHLKAGTATAETAPLKLTSGTLLTAPEAGAAEFLTDDFYGTITTGAARKKFVLDNGTDLVAGDIPYITTNGRLASQTPVADGTYTVGIGLVTNGTITITNGIITAIQEAN